MTQENGEIMFVGKDVAQALGYSNTSKAIQQHVYKEDKSTLPIREGGYKTRAIAINESGLYSLVLSSKLPQAKAFKRWVTSEVHVDAEDKLESQIATSGQRRAIILINN